MNLYAEHILDHYHNPKNWGQLDVTTHQSVVNNPTCGDILRFTVLMVEDSVKEIAWTGEGCAISLAGASLLTEKMKGKTKEEIFAFSSEDMLALLELPLSPARIKCAILSLEGLQIALHNPLK